MATPTQMARTAAKRFNQKPALLSERHLDIGQDLHQLAIADHAEQQAAYETGMAQMLDAYNMIADESGSDAKSFAYYNGIAVIPVHGSLINRFSCSWGFVTGYNFIRSQFYAAMEDPDVQLIVFDVDSGGGEAAGCFELCDEIYAGRDIKPSLAVIDSNAYSAAYAIASSATDVYLTPSGGAGSIGVILLHFDYSKMLEESGIEVTIIKSGDFKADGNPYQSLSDETKARLQAEVDAARDVFVQVVARNRGMDLKAVYDTEAATYPAKDALALGLVDGIVSPSTALEYYAQQNESSEEDDDDESSGSDDDDDVINEDIQMATVSGKPGARTTASGDNSSSTASLDQDAIRKEAVTAERQRLSEIVSCEEAKGREKLANHLAFNTDMSLDAIKATLKVSAVETAAGQAAAATQEQQNQNSGFKAAMDTTGNPNIAADSAVGAGASASADGKETPEQVVARIQAARAKATGRPLKAK